MTKAEARVEVPMGSREAAEEARRSLAPSDDAYVSTTVEGSVLVVTVEADGPGELRAALDDALANVDLLRDVTAVGGDDPDAG